VTSTGGIYPAESKALTYKERLFTVRTYTASMPYLQGSYDPNTHPAAHKDRFYTDIGSGGNVMTRAELQQNERLLKQVGAQLYNIEPVRIGLYDEGVTVESRQLLVGVPITLGNCVYLADFFIVENGCFPAILGHCFFVQYDLMPRTRHGDCLINIWREWLRPGACMPRPPYWARSMGHRYQPKQRLPMYWDGNQLTVRLARQ